jgi:hypothetical protein
MMWMRCTNRCMRVAIRSCFVVSCWIFKPNYCTHCMLSTLRLLCIVLCICDVMYSECELCHTLFGKLVSVFFPLCIMLFLFLEQCLQPIVCVSNDFESNRAALLRRRMQAINWCVISRKAEAMLRMRWMLDVAQRSGSGRVLRRTVSEQTGLKCKCCCLGCSRNAEWH